MVEEVLQSSSPEGKKTSKSLKRKVGVKELDYKTIENKRMVEEVLQSSNPGGKNASKSLNQKFESWILATRL